MATASLANVRPGAPDNTFNWLLHFGQPGPLTETAQPLFLGDGTDLPISLSTGGVTVSGLATATEFQTVGGAILGTNRIHIRGSRADVGVNFLADDITANVDLQVPATGGTLATTDDLHEETTVSGNGIQITGQQISLSIGTGATQVAAGNHGHTAAEVGAVGLTGNELVAGDKTLSGITKMPNQTAATADSVMTRGLVDAHGLFGMLASPGSDHAVYVTNSGIAQQADGDSLASGTTANARPLAYRFRATDKNPVASGVLTLDVRPMSLASLGVFIHPGSANAAGKFRCGVGIRSSGSPSGEANALLGKGFGWEIFWDAATSKIRFRLFAHDGSNYVTNDGVGGRSDSVDTGVSASETNAMFFVLVALDAAGIVTAHAAFGTFAQIRAVSRTTPTLSLSGGPTSGNFDVTGYPLWQLANHSTNAPSTQMQARITSRELVLD